MIDLSFVWDDGAPVLLFCSDGRKYILLKAKVVHHLPLITTEELAVLLSAISACTTHAQQQNFVGSSAMEPTTG